MNRQLIVACSRFWTTESYTYRGTLHNNKDFPTPSTKTPDRSMAPNAQ